MWRILRVQQIFLHIAIHSSSACVYVIYDAIIYSKRPLLRLRPLPSNNELSADKAHYDYEEHTLDHIQQACAHKITKSLCVHGLQFVPPWLAPRQTAFWSAYMNWTAQLAELKCRQYVLSTAYPIEISCPCGLRCLSKVYKSAQSNLRSGPRRGAVAHVRCKVPIGYNGAPQIRPQKYPFPWTDRQTPPSASSLDPSDLQSMPNSIRIRSAVFPQCTGQTDRPTDRSFTGKFDNYRPRRG